MNRIFSMIGCILILTTLISCSNENKEASAAATNEKPGVALPSDSTDFIAKKTYEDLLLRIDNLEKEIDSLKAESSSEKNDIKDFGTIINALNNIDTGDDILLSMELEKDFLTAVHVKVPKKEYLTYKFYLLAGYEADNVPIFNYIIKPRYDTSNNPEKVDIDKDKFELYKLMPSKLVYNETSVLLIIVVDSNGKEYSHFIPSPESSRDI